MSGFTLAVQKSSVWRQEATSPAGWPGAGLMIHSGEIDVIQRQNMESVGRKQRI